MVDRVIVSTEDAEIADFARRRGAEVPFIRPADLSEDHVSLIPVITHAARAMEDLGFHATVVISLQPTAPLLRSLTIDQGVRMLLSTRCDSVVSVRRILHNHPYRVQQMDHFHCITPLFPHGEKYLQKQDLPLFFAITGGLYVRQRQLLDSWYGNDFCLGDDRRGIEIDEREALDIDSKADLLFFRFLVEQQLMAEVEV